MRKFVQLLLGAGCLLMASSVSAQNNTDSVSLNGQYQVIPVAIPFLRMNQDIRSAGIGESGVALPGSNITHYANPARMLQVENKSAVALAYTPWMSNLAKNISLYSASGYYKFSSVDVFSAGLRYFKQGKLQLTDEYGQNMGESSPYDLAVDLSYARKITDRLHLGASFRYINSHIISSGYDGYKNGNAVAADLGLYYASKINAKGQSLHLGAALTNIGSKVKYGAAFSSYQLPANLAVGAAFKQKMQEVHQLIFSAELNKLLVASSGNKQNLGNTIQYNFGGEYAYHEILAIRAGYSYASRQVGGLQYLTMGLGVKYKICRFDVAYLIPSGRSTASTISNTFKLGLGFIIQ
ncbi:MAG: PorV/PorQ family protein [Agriterribacter sp.]